MNKTNPKEHSFTFQHVKKENLNLIWEWLAQDHVAEWFHGIGLENTLQDLSKFTTDKTSLGTHWLAYDGDNPFAYLITSIVEKTPDDEIYTLYCKEDEDAITLDLLIGNRKYLGKGLGHRLIQEFLLTQFPEVDTVFIDPEVANTRAVHVYEKAGFKIIDEFIASWKPLPHYRMKLDMKTLKSIHQNHPTDL